MSPTLRQNTWIITLSLAAMAAVYLKFIWLPGHRTIKELGEQVENKRAFVTQSAGLSAVLVATQRELETAKIIVDQWDKAAPGKRDIPLLYANIDALAQKAHLAIDRFDPQPFVLHEQLQEIPVNISCTGTFAQIYEFLRSLEGLPASTWIEPMRLEKTSQNTKDVQCELNLVVFSDNLWSSDYTRRND